MSAIDDKPLSVALREINEDKLSIKADEKLPAAPEVEAEAL